MTQSGGPRQSAADFIASLARSTPQSQRAILRAARAAGYRISNQVGRAVVNATRGLGITEAQSLSLINIRLDQRSLQGTLGRLRERVQRAVRGRLEQRERQQRLRINYQVRATVGFLWEGRRESAEVVVAVVDRQATIRPSQEAEFRARLPQLARTHARALNDQGARIGGFNPRYGLVYLETPPEAQIVSVERLGPAQYTGVRLTGL